MANKQLRIRSADDRQGSLVLAVELYRVSSVVFTISICILLDNMPIGRQRSMAAGAE
jgi:hypothetical protein